MRTEKNKATFIISLLSVSVAQTTLRLPALVRSHMVLQRDRPVPVWGWAAPDEAVTLTFAGKTYHASAPDATGRWQATLPATPAGGPYTLTVRGRNKIELTDILLGDVWLATGQSNMEFQVKSGNNAAQEIAAANWPNIRFFKTDLVPAYQPQADVAGTGWQVCSPVTVADFSAAAYFFSRDLYQHYQVPMGVVVSAWGGTPAECWVSAEGLRTLPEFGASIANFARKTTVLRDDQLAYEAKKNSVLLNVRAYVEGPRPAGQNWAAPTLDARAWPTMALPGYWEAPLGPTTYDGVVWFRKEIDLPASLAGQPLALTLGKIDAADSTFFNGVKVGDTAGYSQLRRYQVPAALVRPGRNVIAVRVEVTGRNGGLTGPAAELAVYGAGQSLPLTGLWQYQIGTARAGVPGPPFAGGGQIAPTALYNGMIAPLIPLAIKGVIWYQGENNASRAAQYRALFPALITDWRHHWGAELPFLFVQLSNFQDVKPEPSESAWAELREAQAQALRLPRTGMATAIDIGDPANIHPHNKQEVGRRLALAARRVAYGDNKLTASGPTYAGMTTKGKVIQLKFSSVGNELLVKEGATVQGFAVAGADRQFHWATARLVGNEVLVQSAAVPAPVAVRYDWADSPNGNLYNKAGLPTVPFRTDTWPGVTEGRK
ncbi:sialate O-acetylesterase [Hymenobacter sp. H14-R3]|uniref:sialate O-acetylesterase n=1 Tax=Hymenobacter sp. H14-R3 TaxID=3046308 RepID=UPI0024BA2799|nr:sialate O-acetylesterase [Hymenobacter sp. H14-R3]MDJ0365332.1 sialate O-acetylesterase [Hymenobacter sp. H14-R3]